MTTQQGFSNLAFRVWFTPAGNVYSVRVWKPCPYQRKTATISAAPFGYRQYYTEEEFCKLAVSKRVLELFSEWRKQQYLANIHESAIAHTVRWGTTFYCWEF
jgi:hypothetical protein